MTVKINADTSNGLQLESDTSGAIDIQSSGVTKASIDSSGNLDIQGRYSGNGNVPAFSVELGSDQTGISDNTVTKLNFDTIETQLGVTFDTTNKRFTVPSGAGGTYYVSATANLRTETNSDLQNINFYIYKNGSTTQTNTWNFTSNYIRLFTCNVSKVLALADGDYVEIYGFQNSGGDVDNEAGTTTSFFQGYKIIGA